MRIRLVVASTITLLTSISLLGQTAGAAPSATSPLVVPGRGSIGLAGLHRPILAFYQTWGAPQTLAEVVQPNVGTYSVATWNTRTVKLLVSFRDRAQQDAGGVSFRGPFHTARGDHLGTTLEQFKQHWPNARVSPGTVAVGRTTFILDAANRVSGIELGVTPIRFPTG